MADSTKVDDIVGVCYEETERRLDSYYDEVRPGEEDSTVPVLTVRGMIPAIIIAIVLIALWIIARTVIMPIYY